MADLNDGKLPPVVLPGAESDGVRLPGVELPPVSLPGAGNFQVAEGLPEVRLPGVDAGLPSVPLDTSLPIDTSLPSFSNHGALPSVDDGGLPGVDGGLPSFEPEVGLSSFEPEVGLPSFESDGGSLPDLENDVEFVSPREVEFFEEESVGEGELVFDDDLDSILGNIVEDEEEISSDLAGVLDSLDEELSEDLEAVEKGEFGSSLFDDDEEEDEEELAIKRFKLDDVMHYAIEAGASDVHLHADDYPLLTVNGDITRVKQFGILPPKLLHTLMYSIISNVLESEFTDELELDTSYVLKEGPSAGRRSRLNIAKSLNHIEMTFRIVSDIIPEPKELGIEQELIDWINLPNGLIMVNGPTGTGKALEKNTLIPTLNGFRRVSEVVRGDVLFDETGAMTNVIEVHPSNDTRFFEVVFSNGEVIKTAGNHLWEVEVLTDEAGAGALFEELLSGEDYAKAVSLLGVEGMVSLAELYDLFSSSSEALIKETLFKEFRGGSFGVDGEVLFSFKEALIVLISESERRMVRSSGGPVVLSSEELFVSGVKDSDGALNWGVPLLSRPVYFPSRGLGIEPYNFGEIIGALSLKEEAFSEYVLSDSSKEFLEEQFLLEYVFTSITQREEFLEGLFSRLSWVRKGGSYSVLFGSKVVAEFLRVLFSSLGWVVSEVFGNLVSSSGEVREVFELSFLPLSTELFDGEFEEERRNFIVEIREIEGAAEDYICFEVDSPSHLYLASTSFIPTHNTTTLASLLNQINLHSYKKIVTVENPIEFLYGNQGKGLVVQREVGKDTRSFTKALNSAMRQNPDLILIGEVRDRTEVDALVRSAESGHLAVSTMHTTSAPMTINRIMDLYTGDEQLRILGTLADVARGFANQTLVKLNDGKGRMAVREILPITQEVSELIRKGDIAGIREYQIQNKMTIEHELVRAVRTGKVDVKEARAHSAYPLYFDKVIKEKFD